MEATNGNILITVEKTVEERTKTGLFKDIRFDKHRKVAICGTVIAVPEWGNREVLYELFQGIPYNRTLKAPYYKASAFKNHVQVGDKVYFHYLTLEMSSNYIRSEGGQQVFRVPVSDVFCYLRKGKMIMNFNWVLAKPYWGEGIKNLEGGRGKTKLVAGKELVTQIVFKPQANMAIISNIGTGIYEQREGIKSGDLVFLTPSSDFDNEIEGEEYWVFKHEDIMAVKRGEAVEPVGDYCLVQIDRAGYKGKLIVNPEYMKESFTGVFVQGGEKVEGFTRGERILFGKKDMRLMMINLVLMRVGNIQATLCD